MEQNYFQMDNQQYQQPPIIELQSNNRLEEDLMEYKINNDYFVTLMFLIIGFMTCNPVFISVLYCTMPKHTSNKQETLTKYIRILTILIWMMVLFNLMIIILIYYYK